MKREDGQATWSGGPQDGVAPTALMLTDRLWPTASRVQGQCRLCCSRGLCPGLGFSSAQGRQLPTAARRPERAGVRWSGLPADHAGSREELQGQWAWAGFYGGTVPGQKVEQTVPGARAGVAPDECPGRPAESPTARRTSLSPKLSPTDTAPVRTTRSSGLGSPPARVSTLTHVLLSAPPNSGALGAIQTEF